MKFLEQYTVSFQRRKTCPASVLSGIPWDANLSPSSEKILDSSVDEAEGTKLSAIPQTMSNVL